MSRLTYLETNVYEESLNRIRQIFDWCDDVIVSMSGGKDSTVVFNLAPIVAQERNRLPLKVLWLDQEAEWQHTVDYMDYIFHRKDVIPYWFQFPMDFTNSLSHEHNFVRIWDENLTNDDFIHPHSPIAITENPTGKSRFHDVMNALPYHCDTKDKKNVGVIAGVRASESLVRRTLTVFGKANYKGKTWAMKPKGNVIRFYPIYDWQDTDIWTALGRNKWKYNSIYDEFYRYGVPIKDFRVSALIHETAWHSILLLQELEPRTYNRFIDRVIGTSTCAHFDDDVIPKTLPPYFKDWREYRDYLLVKLVKPEYHELFRNRWKNQNDTEWYKIHVRECIINDIDGTINQNAKIRRKKDENKSKYQRMEREQRENAMIGKQEG